MKTITLLLITLSTSIFSMSIDAAIKTAHQNNPIIVALQDELTAKSVDIKNSALYKNPILSFGFTDINLENPDQRDLEAMQTNYITIAQEITQNSKLNLKEKIEKLNYNILSLKIEDQKNLITKKINEISYKISEMITTIPLLKAKMKNLKLSNNYHSTHIKGSMTLQQTLQNNLQIDEISIKILNLEEKLAQQYIILEDIVTKEVKVLEYNGTSNILVNNNSNQHPLVHIKQLKLKKQTLFKQLKIEQKIPNYTLSGGYFQRDARDDYINLAIKIPLNIYGYENNNVQKAHSQIQKSTANIMLVKNKLHKQYKIEKSKLTIANRSVLITNNIIESLNQELNLISTQNSTGTITKSLKIKNKILNKRIALINYKKAQNIAKINISYYRRNNND